MSYQGSISKAFEHAFPLTVPIGLSFIALGAALGLFSTSQGFPAWVPVAIAALVYAGSMEFITVGMLLSGFDPIGAFILTLMVNGRHIFYGVSILNKYQGLGWKKWPLIAGLVDESFAVNISTKLPDDMDHGWFYLHITWLLYLYWLLGVGIGSLAGSLLQGLNMKGIEFAMEALFIVIFLDMMRKNLQNKRFIFGLVGLFSSAISLVLLGPKNFALPAIMLMIAYCFVLYRKGRCHHD